MWSKYTQLGGRPKSRWDFIRMSPVCGGILEHPIWKISECNNCGLSYDRNRVSSLSISIRGLDLCGTPFAVSGSASWHSMKNNYLYHPDQVIIENANDCKKEQHNNP
jgi:transposase